MESVKERKELMTVDTQDDVPYTPTTLTCLQECECIDHCYQGGLQHGFVVISRDAVEEVKKINWG